MVKETIALRDALRVLAFVGDMSMGQPIDHSARTAWLAQRIAEALALDATDRDDVAPVALLRWSGCSANASLVAATIADDVRGRAAMLALQTDRIDVLVPAAELSARITAISSINCEVSGIVAETLGLPRSVASALQSTFEEWDGTGVPRGLARDAIPAVSLVVALAGDFDIFERTYGFSEALALITTRADARYPRAYVDVLRAHADRWFAELTTSPTLDVPSERDIDLVLIADVIDLKLPWLHDHSRAVADVAWQLALAMGYDATQRAHIKRAGLLHGLGRATVPNALWDPRAHPSSADSERIALSPYWTMRALKRIDRTSIEGDIASFVCERLDGTGYFRGSNAQGTPRLHRILPVAASWVALQEARPWRAAANASVATRRLIDDVRSGALDREVVDSLHAATSFGSGSRETRETAAPLSSRELEVLRRISFGHSNKETAEHLGISPATVRTHVESIFRKLGCTSRAAATLKASIAGLL